VILVVTDRRLDHMKLRNQAVPHRWDDDQLGFQKEHPTGFFYCWLRSWEAALNTRSSMPSGGPADANRWPWARSQPSVISSSN